MNTKKTETLYLQANLNDILLISSAFIHTVIHYSFIMGRFNQALDIFREAEELSPRQDHEICHFIGELLHRSAAAANQLTIARQEEAEAKLYFEKAVQAGKNLESFQRLAEILRKEKNYTRAIEVLENCLL